MCDLYFSEGFVLIWRHGETIVAVGSQVIRDSDKYRLEGGEFGYTLLVSLADEGDAGNYSCQISSFNPSILNHSVSIRSKFQVKPPIMVVRDCVLLALFIKFHNLAQLLCHFCPCRIRADNGTTKLKSTKPNIWSPWSPCISFRKWSAMP